MIFLHSIGHLLKKLSLVTFWIVSFPRWTLSFLVNDFLCGVGRLFPVSSGWNCTSVGVNDLLRGRSSLCLMWGSSSSARERERRVIFLTTSSLPLHIWKCLPTTLIYWKGRRWLRVWEKQDLNSCFQKPIRPPLPPASCPSPSRPLPLVLEAEERISQFCSPQASGPPLCCVLPRPGSVRGSEASEGQRSVGVASLSEYIIIASGMAFLPADLGCSLHQWWWG